MRHNRIRLITMVGVFTALSNILYFFQIPLPIFPSFLSLDPSDLPALIVGIIYGPALGITVEFLKNLVAYILNGSYVGLPMGQMANFFSGAIMVGLASMLYRKRAKPSIFYFIPIILIFLSAMYVLNLYLVLPVIVKLLGMNMADYVNWVKVTNPYVNSLGTIVLFVVTPFNLIKILSVYIIGIPLALKIKQIIVRDTSNHNIEQKEKFIS